MDIQEFVRKEIRIATKQLYTDLRADLITNVINPEIRTKMAELKHAGGDQQSNNQLMVVETKIRNSVLAVIAPKMKQLEDKIENATADGQEIVTKYRLAEFKRDNPSAQRGSTYF